jgi:hypothetical protein
MRVLMLLSVVLLLHSIEQRCAFCMRTEPVVVGLVDSGVSTSLVSSRVLPGVSLVDGIPSSTRQSVSVHGIDDTLGHGTMMASIVLGYSRHSVVLPLKVFDDQLKCPVSRICRAIDVGCERGARVICLCLGTSENGSVKRLYAACERALNHGSIVVAAGHNFGGGWSYPAVFANVIGVGRRVSGGQLTLHSCANGALEFFVSGTRRAVGLTGTVSALGSSSSAAAFLSGLVATVLFHEPHLNISEVRARLASEALAESAFRFDLDSAGAVGLRKRS